MALGDVETEGDGEFVCVIVSEAEPNDADAEALAVKTLGVVDTVAVFVLTVCVGS